jgi:hypothetical protein
VLSTAATLPARVSGDAARLRQVLLSLVGNAIRFTGRGAVVLKVFPCGGHDLIRFEVHDTGVGIPPETRNRLFSEPAESAAPTGRRPRAAGLGLGICTRLVTAMGGDIGFESEPGEGSIFWFEVPLRAAAGPATVGASSMPVGTRRRAVLLAPNGPGREGARELLTSFGLEVVAADAARVGDCDLAVIHHSALPQAPFSRRGKHAARPWVVFGFGALRWSGDVEGVVEGALKPSQLGHVLATIFDRPEQDQREARGRPQPRTLPASEPARRLSSAELPHRPERERPTLDRSHSDRRHVA